MKSALTFALMGIVWIAQASAQERHLWEVGGGLQSTGSHEGLGWVADLTVGIKRIGWMVEGSGLIESPRTTTTTTIVSGLEFHEETETFIVTREPSVTTYTALSGPVFIPYRNVNVYVSCRLMSGVVIRSIDSEAYSNLATKTGCGIGYAIHQQLGARVNIDYLYLAGGGGEHVPVVGGGLFVRF